VRDPQQQIAEGLDADLGSRRRKLRPDSGQRLERRLEALRPRPSHRRRQQLLASLGAAAAEGARRLAVGRGPSRIEIGRQGGAVSHRGKATPARR
jgi:hypothetical protein